MTFAPEPLLRAVRFEGAVQQPLAAFVRFVALAEAPFCLDVLQVYVVFLAFAPFFAALLIASRAAAAIWLLACWSLVQMLFHRAAFVPDTTIAMDLWAWQALFFGGMLLGTARLYRPLLSAMTDRPWVPAAAIGTLLMLMAALFGQNHYRWLGLAASPWTLAGTDRQTLGPVNALSCLALVLVMMWATERLRLSETRPGRWLATAGRFSLSTFCISNLGVYATAFVWQISPTRTVYLLMEAGMVAAMLAWCHGAAALQTRASARAGAAIDHAPEPGPRWWWRAGSRSDSAIRTEVA